MTEAIERTAPSEAWAAREAVVLPLIFLTVALLGGMRVSADGSGFRFVPPPLISLVLAVLLIAVLVRGRRLEPLWLMSNCRAPLENLNGSVVLVTLFFASAQLFNCVAPDAGLAHLVFNTVLFLLLWNTLAAGPEAGRLLHSLLVLFGSAFILKHIVLAGLYAPEAGLTRRVLTVLLEGVTLGTMDGTPQASATGYVAFAAVLLFFVGLFLLPGAPAPGRERPASAYRPSAPDADRILEP